MLREGQFPGTMAALSSSWFKVPYVIRASVLGSHAHIYLSLSASHLLFSKALPGGSGCSLVNLKSPAHFLGTQLFTGWFENRRKVSILQPPMCFWPLAHGVTSCAEEGMKCSHHPLCPHRAHRCLPRDGGTFIKLRGCPALGFLIVSILHSFNVQRVSYLQTITTHAFLYLASVVWLPSPPPGCPHWDPFAQRVGRSPFVQPQVCTANSHLWQCTVLSL